MASTAGGFIDYFGSISRISGFHAGKHNGVGMKVATRVLPMQRTHWGEGLGTFSPVPVFIEDEMAWLRMTCVGRKENPAAVPQVLRRGLHSILRLPRATDDQQV